MSSSGMQVSQILSRPSHVGPHRLVLCQGAYFGTLCVVRDHQIHMFVMHVHIIRH